MFNLCYFSNGGFPFSDVYKLPVIKRKFFLQLLNQTKVNEKAAIDAAQGGNTSHTPPPTPDRYKRTIKKS